MSATTSERFFKLSAIEVAGQHLQHESSRGKPDGVQVVQSSHRLDIIYAWLVGADPIATASGGQEAEADFSLLSGRVMDLGCGQGDQTGALVSVIAKSPQRFLSTDAVRSSIVGVDPGSPDYGSPFTLQQAQDHLSQNATLSPYLSFVLGQTAPEVLESQRFDTVLLSHSLWYFPSVDVIRETFRAIRNAGVKRLLIAEWAMSASHPNALPHLLSVLLQAQSPLDGGNVQTPLSPDQIRAAAADAGWKLDRQLTFAPNPKLQDGGWEIHMAREAADATKQHPCRADDKLTQKLLQSVQATRFALEQAAARTAPDFRSMDVWTAVLSPA